MRPVRKLSVLCLALVLAVSLGLATEAAAKTKKSHPGSAITLESVGPDAITGRISSDEGACRTQRHVTVYRVNTESSVPSGELVAATWTRGDGSWEIPGPLFPSEFYAVADRKTAKGIVCDPLTSNTLHWG
jgi:hypothetical protein